MITARALLLISDGRLGWGAAQSCWGRRRSCTRPGSAVPSGWVISSPVSAWPARSRRSGCSGRPRDYPAAGAGTAHRRLRCRAADRGHALPIGVRRRQLSARTLLAGMCLALAGGRPAHLTRVHRALASLPEDDQRRLGVLADWKPGPHPLTCRQAEYTFGLVVGALAKDEPDGLPSATLAGICDGLLEASIPGGFKDASASLARGLDGPGLILPTAPGKRRSLRRSRGLLGTPQEQPAAQRR